MEPNNENRRFSEPVVTLLIKAGWYEERNVLSQLTLPLGFEHFKAADTILAEFGGLKIGECGRGIERATSDLEIDPSLCDGLEGQLAEASDRRKVKLYPLGEVHHGHGCVIVDEIGIIYLLSDVLEKWADSFDEALEILLLGKKPKSS